MRVELGKQSSQLDQNRLNNEEIQRIQNEIVIYLRIGIKFICFFFYLRLLEPLERRK